MTARAQQLIEKFRKRVGLLGWGAVIVFLILRLGDLSSLVCRVFLGRALSPMDFGAWDPVFAALAVLLLPLSIVFQIAVKSISRLRALGREDSCRSLCRHLWVVTVLWILVSALIEYGFSDFILVRLHITQSFYIHILVALTAVLCVQIMLVGIFQGVLDYKQMTIFNGVNAFLIVALTVSIVLATGTGLAGALAARLVAGFISVVLALCLVRSLFIGITREYRDEWVLIKEMIFPMSIYMISVTILFNADRLFVRNFMVDDSGGYGAIATLGIVPCYFITPVIYVIFPLASAEHATGGDLSSFLKQALIVGLAVTIVCMVGFIFLAEPIIRVWRADFVPYAHLVWVYALYAGLHGVIQIIASVEMARHRYGFLWVFIVPAVCMLCVLYYLRAILAVPIVLWVLTLTHLVVLSGLVYRHFSAEKIVSRSAA